MNNEGNEQIVMSLEIEKIRTDGGTQLREYRDDKIVSEYSELIRDGMKFPPIEVVYDGISYWLVDGFHRLAAHRMIGQLQIEACVSNGTQRDAVFQAAKANSSHGLPRTREGKKNAVMTLLDDPEWSSHSDRQIAQHVNVSHSFVAKVRRDKGGNRRSETRFDEKESSIPKSSVRKDPSPSVSKIETDNVLNFKLPNFIEVPREVLAVSNIQLGEIFREYIKALEEDIGHNIWEFNIDEYFDRIITPILPFIETIDESKLNKVDN